MRKGKKTRRQNELIRLSLFVEIGKVFASAKTLREVMHQVMEKIGDIFAPLNWSLLLEDRKTGKLYFKLVVGASADKLRGLKIPKGKGVANWIFETGQAVIIENVKKDPRFSRRFDRITKFGTKSIIGVPLTVNNKTIGVIELINKMEKKSFSPVDLKILSAIADFAAIAIEKIYYLSALRKMVSVDPLTGVYNRRSLAKTSVREFERCKRYGYEISLLMIDVDNFKKINDTLGHLAGDKVLKDLASIMKKNIRKVDTIARYGGDEFVILMPHTKGKGAKKARMRILEHIKKHNRKRKEIPFTVSIGMSSAGPERVFDLFSKSDINLYKEKYHKEEKNLENIEEYFQDLLEEEEASGEK